MGIGYRHGLGPASVLEDGRDDVSMICLGNGRETGQPDSAELDELGQCTAYRTGDVTENGVATLGNVTRNWRETSMVCNVDITDVILPSDAE